MPTIEEIVERTVKMAQMIGRVPTSKGVSLWRYVESVKNLKLDPWQKDLCDRLEKIFWLSQAGRLKFDGTPKFSFTFIDIGSGELYLVTPSKLKIPQAEFLAKKNKGSKLAIHSFPQIGKSAIASHCYPAWILGYDPTHRFRLATYGISHSREFSQTVLDIIRSPEHRGFFPPDDCQPEKAHVNSASWYTNARRALRDGQSSFMALGLMTGFVGKGYDTLLMDDPFPTPEAALSQKIRDKTGRFYTHTAHPRCEQHSNEISMFHRYHQDDLTGRILATGAFELVRYAAQHDGDYEVEETGLKYACLPLGHKEGEYLSSRRPPEWYEEQKKNDQVWQSMFQGRPTSESGSFFDTSKIVIEDWTPEREAQIIHLVRSWDNAATEGAGDFTAGAKMGITANEHVYVFEMAHEQVNTAGRRRLQRDTAERDGPMVAITHPKDPGSTGLDVAFDFSQSLMKDGYVVEIMPTTGDKTQRASPYSRAVNEGRVHFVRGRSEASEWDIKGCLVEMRYFPNGTLKDRVDGMADGYKYLDKLFHRGLVIKSFTQSNVLPWQLFAQRFGPFIPEHWEIARAIRLAPDSSKPSGWCIVARAAEDAMLGEAVFIVDADRQFVDGIEPLITAMEASTAVYCPKRKIKGTVWVKSDGGDVIVLASEKHQLNLTRYEGEDDDGLAETNWYLQSLPRAWPFGDYPGKSATRLYLFAHAVAAEQDIRTWSYNEKGKPQTYGGVSADCLRMCLLNFALKATKLTPEQAREAKLPENLRMPAVVAKLGTPDFVDDYWSRHHALNQIDAAAKTEAAKQGNGFLNRKATVRRYRK